MISCAAYRDERFLEIIAGIYRLRRVHPLGKDDLDYLAPFFQAARNGGRRLFSLPIGFHHAPPFQDRAHEQRFFMGLDEYSRAKGINVTLSSTGDYAWPRRVYLSNNPVLELAGDYEAQRRRYSRNLRAALNRNRNKAARLGIRIEESTDESLLEDFWKNVFVMQYIRKHRMLFQPLGLFQGLVRSGLATFLVAHQDRVPIGGLLLIRDEDTLHYNWGASLAPENVAVGTLLVDEAIHRAIEQDFRWFDLGSTPPSDEQLLHFKLRFGAASIPVYRYYTLDPEPVLDLHQSYGLARACYARMPQALLRFLVPRLLPWLVR